MARCGCAEVDAPGAEGCACALQAGANVTVTGTGQGASPWIVSSSTSTPQIRAALSGVNGVAYDPVTGIISARLSTDAGNALVLGGDTGLFVPPVVTGSPLGMIVFDTAVGGNWNKADNPTAKWLRVRVIGGGGGGAGALSAAAQALMRGGGAGGNYSESWLEVSTLPASVAITVGTGGAAGNAANGAGGLGGFSGFGTIVTALGGNGAPNTAVTATSGVSPSGGPGGSALGGGTWS